MKNISTDCSIDNYAIFIPYKDFCDIVDMAKNYKEVLAHVNRLEKQYAAMLRLHSEVLQVCKETKDFVRDT